MKLHKAIRILERRMNHVISRAFGRVDEGVNYDIQEASALNLAIGQLKEQMEKNPSLNLRYFHPELEDLRAAQMALAKHEH